MTKKSQSILQISLFLVGIVLLNILGNMFFKRFDLTTDKRFSLNSYTQNQLSTLDDIVFIRVYLEGDLPASFMQLRNATQEILDEMRVYAGENLQYEFINPSANPDNKIRQSVYQELSKKGLQYTDLTTREVGKTSEQIIFPGAIIAFHEKEIPVQLLKNSMGTSPEEMMHNSIQQLEYEISSAIKRLKIKKVKRVAFIQGHGEASEIETQSIADGLREFYEVKYLTLNEQINKLDGYDAIAIVGPDTAYTEKDKFIIDQFIMNGGKALWFTENTQVNADSLKRNGITLGLAKNTNLNDMLFKYGVRINSDLVMDMQALPIPVVTGSVGDQPRQELFPWFYFPMVFSNIKHPITNNLDAIAFQYAGSIDTVGGKGIVKTPLLYTSKYAKVTNVPTRVSLSILRDKPDPRRFNGGKKMLATLLEGEFESVFKNRLPKRLTNSKEIKFKAQGETNKMIVVSSASVIKNEVSTDGKKYMPLGYYKYANRNYGNKDFVLNCFNYLLEEDELILSRVKDFKIRLLDQNKVNKFKSNYQVANTALPILIVVIVGFVLAWIRKRKYTQH